MYDYPHFDGTQACQNPTPDASAFRHHRRGPEPGPVSVLACPSSTSAATAPGHDVYGVWEELPRTTVPRSDPRASCPPCLDHDQLDDLVIAMRACVVDALILLVRAHDHPGALPIFAWAYRLAPAQVAVARCPAIVLTARTS